jgi:hypothetical protein
VRERIEYRFRVPSAAIFTLYSYSKALEYRFRVPTAGSLITRNGNAIHLMNIINNKWQGVKQNVFAKSKPTCS